MNPGDIPTQGDEVEQEITKFVDTFRLEQQEQHTTNVMSHLALPSVTLQRFLERPYLVGSFTWSKTNKVGPLWEYIPFPDTLYASNILYDKLQNIFFIKGDVEITIRVNGTQMHYGRLLAGWLPQSMSLSPNYTDFPTIGCTNFVQVSATSQTDTQFIVPYHQYVNKQIISGEKKDWFGVFIFVSSLLRNYDGDDVASIGVSVFARFINLSVSGYTYESNTIKPQGSEASMLTGLKQVVSKTDNIFQKASTAAKAVKGAISAGEGIASSFGGVIQGISSLFGFSVPPSLATISPAQIVMPRFMQYADNPNTLMIGTSQKDQTDTDPALVLGGPNDYMIHNYISRPCLLGHFDITSEMAAGYCPVGPFAITPMNMLYQSSDFAIVPGRANYPLPMAYVGTMFSMWRGSIDFHISVVCSRFHSCRIRILWIPQFIDKSKPSPDQYEAQNAYSVVLDVTAEFEYSFRIPYMQETEWLYCGDVAPGAIATEEDARRTTNGWMFIQVVNELTSGASSDKVQPITFQLFARAGPDFEFAIPSMIHANKLTFDTVDTKNLFATLLAETKAKPQVNEALTVESLRTAKYETFGPEMGSRRDNVNAQSIILTFKQMLNMLSPMTVLNYSEPKDISYSFDFTKRIPGSAIDTVLFFRVLALFRYYRGSFRIAVLPLKANPGITFARFELNSDAEVFTERDTVTNYEAIEMSQGMTFHSRTDLAPVDVVLPWNDIFDRKLVNANVLPVVSTLSESQRAVIFLPQCEGSVILSLSGGDDLSVGFLLPPPRCIIPKTAEKGLNKIFKLPSDSETFSKPATLHIGIMKSRK